MGLKRKKHKVSKLGAAAAAKVRRLLGLSPRAHLLIVQTEDDPRYQERRTMPPEARVSPSMDTPRSHLLRLQAED